MSSNVLSFSLFREQMVHVPELSNQHRKTCNFCQNQKPRTNQC